MDGIAENNQLTTHETKVGTTVQVLVLASTTSTEQTLQFALGTPTPAHSGIPGVWLVVPSFN
jgi:hypothetical protein